MANVEVNVYDESNKLVQSFTLEDLSFTCGNIGSSALSMTNLNYEPSFFLNNKKVDENTYPQPGSVLDIKPHIDYKGRFPNDISLNEVLPDTDAEEYTLTINVREEDMEKSISEIISSEFKGLLQCQETGYHKNITFIPR